MIPLLNPDGRDKVEADLVAGRNNYRRGNEKNVDLNRDFAVNTEARAIWRFLIPGYYAHSEVPLSQPESQALDALAAREVYDRAVSLHAFGGFFYYPWSGRFSPPPDEADFMALGRVDRLAIGPDAVVVADFKTGRAPAEDAPLPEAETRQIALYAALLAQIFPGRRIVPMLVWTSGPTLRHLSADEQAMALGKIAA